MISPEYPQEYIDGTVHFFGRDFCITPDVLIPRLESEGLVRKAQKILALHPKIAWEIIDVGCGSGILGISLAPNATSSVFLDISKQALTLAQKNFHTHFPKKEATFLLSDLLKNYRPSKQCSALCFVVNLPYIRNNDWGNMSPDTHYEPPLALFGGAQHGFELYERFLKELLAFSQKNPRYPLSCLCEFGFDQKNMAQKLLASFPLKNNEFFEDYAGIPRFCAFSL